MLYKFFNREYMDISTRTNGSVWSRSEPDSDFKQNDGKILEFAYPSAGQL